MPGSIPPHAVLADVFIISFLKSLYRRDGRLSAILTKSKSSGSTDSMCFSIAVYHFFEDVGRSAFQLIYLGVGILAAFLARKAGAGW